MGRIVDLDEWAKRKAELRERLMEDLEIGYLDKDIIDILLMFFQREESFTISSCSGRISVLDGPLPWVRKGSTIIFKKHEPITEEDVMQVLKQPAVETMWLIVTGPIIHVSTASLREAVKILSIAREAGMKHSGILSLGRRGIIVELRTGVRVTVPLKHREKVLINTNEVKEVVDLANRALFDGKRRLERLRNALRGRT